MAQKRTYTSAKNPRRLRPSLRDTLRKRVIATYDTCAICGREVDKTLHYLDPLAPEVDEIIPVSRGGSPYDWDNLQLGHRICNQRKGAKMAGDIDLKGVVNPTPISKSW